MIISCPECHKEISDQAIQCPGCGFPLEKPNPNLPPILDTSSHVEINTTLDKKYDAVQIVYSTTDCGGVTTSFHSRSTIEAAIREFREKQDLSCSIVEVIVKEGAATSTFNIDRIHEIEMQVQKDHGSAVKAMRATEVGANREKAKDPGKLAYIPHQHSPLPGSPGYQDSDSTKPTPRMNSKSYVLVGLLAIVALVFLLTRAGTTSQPVPSELTPTQRKERWDQKMDKAQQDLDREAQKKAEQDALLKEVLREMESGAYDRKGK